MSIYCAKMHQFCDIFILYKTEYDKLNKCENNLVSCSDQGDIDLCGGDPNDGIDSDCSASSNSGKQVLVGICAMAKKAQSKPMTEILTRLREFDYIHMIIFDEEVILKVSAHKNVSPFVVVVVFSLL